MDAELAPPAAILLLPAIGAETAMVSSSVGGMTAYEISASWLGSFS